MKILAKHISVFTLLSLFAYVSTASPISLQVEGASVEEARATLVRLIRLSDSQALRTEEARKLFVGEMAELNIPSFGKLTSEPDKVVMLEKNQAVGRVQRFGNNNQVTDVYFYLTYDGGWKVSAVRLLALTGIIEQASLALKAKPNLTEEEKADLANFKLILATDKELAAWFAENRAALETLYNLAKSKSGGRQVYIRSEDKEPADVIALLNKLHLSGLSIETDGDVQFIFGGITDNVVGLIHSPSKNPPAISPSSYIWVEEVAAKWYLFRTT